MKRLKSIFKHPMITACCVIIGYCTFLSACRTSSKVNMPNNDSLGTIYIQSPDTNTAAAPQKIEKVDPLREKYATLLKVSPDQIHNLKLYHFVDEWMETPYLWGGNSKSGIDCSAFVKRLFNEVYGIHIPRTSIQQFFSKDVEPFGSMDDLHEGDMVFFRTLRNKTVSHVGFYLANNKFVNASSHNGVSIGDLQSPYWKRKYVAAGRIKASFRNNATH